ncbi:MAG: BMC domain-containing protein [Clostridia bacterium]|nr:BMC domain-containing protein [Clostridia bacterium]
MEITALGMIETSGLLSAIEAADAGLKAANVRLLGTDYVRGGLVMVRFEGDVAAVQAAVDAGTMAAQRVGVVVSSHVIPRAMPEVFCMLASDPGVGPGKRSQGGCAACGGCEGGMRELRRCREASATERKEKQTEEKAENKQQPDSAMPSLEELKTWKVVALRSFARKLPGFSMKAGEIRYANKAQLLSALAEYIKSL